MPVPTRRRTGIEPWWADGMVEAAVEIQRQARGMLTRTKAKPRRDEAKCRTSSRRRSAGASIFSRWSTNSATDIQRCSSAAHVAENTAATLAEAATTIQYQVRGMLMRKESKERMKQTGKHESRKCWQTSTQAGSHARTRCPMRSLARPT